MYWNRTTWDRTLSLRVFRPLSSCWWCEWQKCDRRHPGSLQWLHPGWWCLAVAVFFDTIPPNQAPWIFVLVLSTSFAPCVNNCAALFPPVPFWYSFHRASSVRGHWWSTAGGSSLRLPPSQTQSCCNSGLPTQRAGDAARPLIQSKLKVTAGGRSGYILLLDLFESLWPSERLTQFLHTLRFKIEH